jgi:phosphate transport system permease protein
MQYGRADYIYGYWTLSRYKIKRVHDLTKKQFDQKAVKYIFTICGFICIIIIAFIIIFLISTGIRFFTVRSFQDLFIGVWNPELELQSNPETTLYFNIIPLLYGSFSITLNSMIFAVPLGICSAIFIAEIAPFKVRMYIKTAIELLAGIPSVVIVYFGLMVVNKFIRDNFNVAGASLLSGSIILGMMCLPIIISVSEDAISVVPKEYKEASYAMGATKWETISKVTMPSAFSGIMVSLILAFGRAIGETMAVIMVVGNNPSIPEPIYNLRRPIYTLTGALGIEIKEVDVNTPWYFALFLLGTILFLISIITNLTSRKIMKKINLKFCPTQTPKRSSLFNKKNRNNLQIVRIRRLNLKTNCHQNYPQF